MGDSPLVRVTLPMFLERPAGRYFAGEHFLYASLEERLYARILWDRPTLEDAELIMAASDIEHRPGPDMAGIFDASGVRDVDWSGLMPITAKLRDRGAPPRCRAHVLVTPPGELGAVASDIYLRYQSQIPRRVVSNRAAGLAWLEWARAEPLLAQAEAEVIADGALVGRVRATLETAPRLSMTDAARRLSLSTRTLQRRLESSGTSFREEVSRARIRLAQRLLRETNRSITEIAYEVGYSSSQSFSRLFRAAVGRGPGDFRRSPPSSE